jgi:murein DD-endopeptidase MepM/ murein hydrolase activator NlpD
MNLQDGISSLLTRWKRKHSMEVNGYHTLLVMSSSSGKRILQLSFPVFFWWVSSVVAVAILFWIGAGAWSAYQNHEIVIRSNCLERENQLAKGKLEEQKQEIEYLQGRLVNIQEQAVYIQSYLGLNSNGEGKGKIGQGGGGISPQFISGPFSSPSLERQTLPAGPDLIQPLKLSHQNINQLDKDLEEIIKSIEKKRHALEHTPYISPVDPQKSWISCGYGMRISPFTGKKQFHSGIDIAGWRGTPIMAPAEGRINFAGRWGSMGITIKIKHNSMYTTTYGHLLKAEVTKGQHVKRGEIIGYMGNSGRSTGYHLHYEIKKDGKRLDPFSYMADWAENQSVLAAGG